MISGMSLALIAIMIIGIVKNVIALKNPKKLKKQYAKENDERNAQIAEKGKSSGASIFLLIMPVFIIISGYFNIIVCFTCLAITFGLSFSMLIGKLYYSKKM